MDNGRRSKLEDLKKQIIEDIENYISKVTEEEINNKLINAEEERQKL